MTRPAADIVGHMSESVREMSRVVADIDLEALTAPQAAQLSRFFDAVEAVAAAGRTLVTPMVDSEPTYRRRWPPR
jgi:hypothetical protein